MCVGDGERAGGGGVGASLTGAVIAEEINSTTHTNRHSESYSGNPTLDGTPGGQVESHQLAGAPQVTSIAPSTLILSNSSPIP